MNLLFKYAAPDESEMYAYWQYRNEVNIILDNLIQDEDYIGKKISDLYLQEYLCAQCNPEDYSCNQEYCPYETVIDQIEREVWG